MNHGYPSSPNVIGDRRGKSERISSIWNIIYCTGISGSFQRAFCMVTIVDFCEVAI